MIITEINKQLKFTIVLSVMAVILFAGCSSPPTHKLAVLSFKQSGTSAPFDHTHNDFRDLLFKYVRNGLVDYRALQNQPDLLVNYTASLAAVDQKTIDTWSRKQQLAFWINAYNAFTIRLIVERYPIRSRSLIGIIFPRGSILQISGVWSRIQFPVGGRKLTLGDIEHEILRKNFLDPRIHFAIVCASSSCPVLRSEPYRYDILEHQLNDQAVQFINDPDRGVRYDDKNKRIYISKIFKWFEEDFTRAANGDSVLTYISRYYLGDEIPKARTENRNLQLSYLPYDWHLNEQVTPTHSAEKN